MQASLLDYFKTLDENKKLLISEITSARDLSLIILALAEDNTSYERLTAEHIVACLEAAGVALKKISVTRALSSATGYISSVKSNDEVFYKIMTKGKTLVESIFSISKVSIVKIEKNQPRTARLKLEDFLSSLDGAVLICDPYYGTRTLDILDKIPLKCPIQFLTQKTNENQNSIRSLIHDFNKEHSNSEFRIASSAAGLHDRYLITKTCLLILGHGFKDIGGKESFIIKLDHSLVPDLISEMIKSFKIKWSSATPI